MSFQSVAKKILFENMSSQDFDLIYDLSGISLLGESDEEQSEAHQPQLECLEEMPADDWSFLEYLKFHQLTPMTSEVRSRIMNYTYRDLCEALEIFSSGGTLFFIKISTDSDLCSDCHGSEPRRLHIKPGFSTIELAGIVQQQCNYCQICRKQLYFILSEIYYFRFFLD